MRKILVIEDEAILREIILDILNAEGFSVISAENGAIGVQLAKAQVPDLVLCNVTLPELDGYDVLRALRQDATTTKIPFLFVSARDTKVDRRHGLELGANGYLTKPLATTELLEAIADLLQT